MSTEAAKHWEALATVLNIAPWLEEHGTRQEGRPIAEEYAHLVGELGQCYMNASRAAFRCPGLRYTEGLLFVSGLPRLPHAWLTGPEGEPIEVTDPWHEAVGLRYLGVTLTQIEVMAGRGYHGRAGYYDPALEGLIKQGWRPAERESWLVEHGWKRKEPVTLR